MCQLLRGILGREFGQLTLGSLLQARPPSLCLASCWLWWPLAPSTLPCLRGMWAPSLCLRWGVVLNSRPLALPAEHQHNLACCQASQLRANHNSSWVDWVPCLLVQTQAFNSADNVRESQIAIVYLYCCWDNWVVKSRNAESLTPPTSAFRYF